MGARIAFYLLGIPATPCAVPHTAAASAALATLLSDLMTRLLGRPERMFAGGLARTHR